MIDAIEYSPCAAFDELAARALVGSDRAGGGKDGVTPSSLLRDTAVTGARVRAGYMPGVDAATVPACEPDELPVASTGAQSLLRQILQSAESFLASEWIELADSRGMRVGESLLPMTLDWLVAQRAEQRGDFERVIGQRGAWLAGLNPAWRSLAKVVGPSHSPPEQCDDESEIVWQTGLLAERLVCLRQIRRAAPERAVALIQSTWKADSADERRKFVAALTEGLSPADEVFLESALDDKSKQVREAAAGLLSTLPNSAHVERMLARATSLFQEVEKKKGLLKKKTRAMTIDPPKEYDKAWARDGIDENVPSGEGKLGKRAWWLRQILSSVPPARLCEKLEVAADELLQIAVESDYAKDAVLALSNAAAAHADMQWISLLIRQRLDRRDSPIIELAGLWASLEPADRESVLLSLVRHANIAWIERWRVLGAVDHRWSLEFSQDAIHALEQGKPKDEHERYEVAFLFDKVSRHVSPWVIEHVDNVIQAAFGDKITPSAIKSMDRLRLRAEMHKEFAK